VSALGSPGPEGGIYTSHGLMLPSDLEEYRQDTDWYELHPRVPEEGECEHCRLFTDDCDDCGRY
jgi:hypothetical protein